MAEPRVCPECGTTTLALICPKEGRPTIEARKLRREDPLLGMVIEGKYRVEQKLGAGGFGAVYRAVHTETGGNVCIKLLHANLCSDEQAVRRFYIEAQNTHKLHHPNTVRVSDFGQTEKGVLFLAMEFVAGQPLSEVIRAEGRVSAGRAVRIVSQILKSLAEAHSHGVVHRDVKPQNIMLIDQIGEPDFVKVQDFGISKAVDPMRASTKGSIGTPRYMAPEQWRAESVDGRADLYSVGCILYQLLAGRTPFVVKGSGTDQALAFMVAHIQNPPDPLLEVAPGACPSPLANLVMQLLEKRREDRPGSAEGVLRTLMRIRQEHGLSEDVSVVAPLPAADPPATNALPRGGAANTETGTLLELGHAPASISTGRRRLGLGLAVVAALVVAVGAWMLAQPENDRVEPAEPPEASPAAASSPEAASKPAVAEAPAAETAPAKDARPGAAPSDAPRTVEAPPPLSPTFVLRSEPTGADVFDAQDKALGQTPLTLLSPPHAPGAKLVLRLAGRRSAVVSASFSEGRKPSERTVSLPALPTLRLESKPTGAEVTVKGGDVLGRTPYEWTVPERALDALDGGDTVALVFVLAGRHTSEKVVTPSLLEGSQALVADLAPVVRHARKPPRPRKARPRPRPRPRPKPNKPKPGAWSID